MTFLIVFGSATLAGLTIGVLLCVDAVQTMVTQFNIMNFELKRIANSLEK